MACLGQETMDGGASGRARADGLPVHDDLRQVALGLSIGLSCHSAQRQEEHRREAHDAHGKSHDQLQGHVTTLTAEV